MDKTAILSILAADLAGGVLGSAAGGVLPRFKKKKEKTAGPAEQVMGVLYALQGYYEGGRSAVPKRRKLGAALGVVGGAAGGLAGLLGGEAVVRRVALAKPNLFSSKTMPFTRLMSGLLVGSLGVKAGGRLGGRVASIGTKQKRQPIFRPDPTEML